MGSLTSEVMFDRKKRKKEGRKEEKKGGKENVFQGRKWQRGHSKHSLYKGEEWRRWGKAVRRQKYTGVAAEEADENEVCSRNRVSADSTSGCKADKLAESWSNSA